MCKVYNNIGCLTVIRARLAQNNIHDFHSLNELISFRDNYATARQEVVAHQEIRLTEERNKLSAEVLALDNEIAKDKLEIQHKLKLELETLGQKYDEVLAVEKNYLQEITQSFVAVFLLLKIKYREIFFNSIVSSLVRHKVRALYEKQIRLRYITAGFKQLVEENVRLASSDMDRKKRVIDEINTFIYGAIGEQKVVKELENLSDEYTLINDFCFSFTTPVHYAEENRQIKTIQIDHLLISPAGIFLIETKNWSKDSVNNVNMRSPVEQIRRSNFALSTILSEKPRLLAKHHWGEKRVPIKNVIVLTNQKPPEEFQHTEVLSLHELLQYVKGFKSSLSTHETQNIIDYLIKVTPQNRKVPAITFS
jgi:hypothetical protein